MSERQMSDREAQGGDLALDTNAHIFEPRNGFLTHITQLTLSRGSFKDQGANVVDGRAHIWFTGDRLAGCLNLTEPA